MPYKIITNEIRLKLNERARNYKREKAKKNIVKPRPCCICNSDFTPDNKHRNQKCCQKQECKKIYKMELDRAYRKLNVGKNNEYQRIWGKNNPEKRTLYIRKAWLKREYGITVDRYKEMLEEQNNLCAICLQPGEATWIRHNKLHVDHDHSKGKVRGLLCARCNAKLGLLESTEEWKRKALEYLEKYK